jgi:hypothetical protein
MDPRLQALQAQQQMDPRLAALQSYGNFMPEMMQEPIVSPMDRMRQLIMRRNQVQSPGFLNKQELPQAGGLPIKQAPVDPRQAAIMKASRLGGASRAPLGAPSGRMATGPLPVKQAQIDPRQAALGNRRSKMARVF